MMLERQREGIARAKAAGKYKGRKPIATEQRTEVVRLAEVGLTKASIAQKGWPSDRTRGGSEPIRQRCGPGRLWLAPSQDALTPGCPVLGYRPGVDTRYR
jgi:hypothetical protein